MLAIAIDDWRRKLSKRRRRKHKKEVNNKGLDVVLGTIVYLSLYVASSRYRAGKYLCRDLCHLYLNVNADDLSTNLFLGKMDAA